MTYYPEVSDLASELDLDEVDSADPRTWDVLEWLADYDRDRVILYGYGPPDGGTGDHFYLAYDHGRQDGALPPFVSVHLHVEADRTSLRADMQDHPMAPLAENWLVGKGADRDRIRQLAGQVFFPLGDRESTEAETLLRESGPRFEVLDSRSTQAGDHFETHTVATDRTPPDPGRPVAAFVEFRTGDAPSYLRAASFPTREAAAEWIREAGKPQPPTVSARAEAARLDSRPDAAPQPDAAAASASSEADRPRPHRR
ncbi:hypothetical protein ACFV6F_08725 [Kitasatospora phosalacinea]|uniref:hypothetical protein n=1 Tax=Kitasatospora phosalacinea TaxID=2065 RepID=UPI0036558AF0